MKRKTDSIRCECMDLLEIAHSDRIYPVMYCKMEIEGNLDLKRLKKAVEISAEFVPEILYSVDFQRGIFVNRHLTVDDVICVKNDDVYRDSKWDLSADTQLKIFISHRDHLDHMIIGMSHILADGRGFLQYLYLLSAIYNDEKKDIRFKNHRDIKIVMKHAPFFLPKGPRMKNKTVCANHNGNKKYDICCRINSMDLKKICQKAESLQVSLNDVFMTVYARVILRYLEEREMTLPCPVDLRQAESVSGKLTIGNMTGMYRAILITVEEKDSFDTTLKQVHKEIRQQRMKKLYFQGIPWLRFIYHKVPSAVLVRMIRKNYSACPTSYTNIGEIDTEKLQFTGCDIKSCYMTGTYRKSPDFQLSVSTFQDVCTLNCMLSGNQQRAREGKKFLIEIKRELLNWINE